MVLCGETFCHLRGRRTETYGSDVNSAKFRKHTAPHGIPLFRWRGRRSWAGSQLSSSTQSPGTGARSSSDRPTLRIGYNFHFLKVDRNEKWDWSERCQWLGITLGLWRSMAICHLNMQFLCKKLFSFSACTSFINRRCLDEFHPFDPLCLFKMWKFTKTIRPNSIGGNNTSASIYLRHHSLPIFWGVHLSSLSQKNN